MRKVEGRRNQTSSSLSAWLDFNLVSTGNGLPSLGSDNAVCTLLISSNGGRCSSSAHTHFQPVCDFYFLKREKGRSQSSLYLFIILMDSLLTLLMSCCRWRLLAGTRSYTLIKVFLTSRWQGAWNILLVSFQLIFQATRVFNKGVT